MALLDVPINIYEEEEYDEEYDEDSSSSFSDEEETQIER